jgi:hypothetical protein
LPYQLFLRRYAPFPTFGGGFGGRRRTAATTSPRAAARTIGLVTFDANGVQHIDSFSSSTEYVGAGKWLAAKIGKQFSPVTSELSNVVADKARNRLSFTVHTAGPNPFLRLVAPNIDLFVDLAVTFGDNTRYEGKVRGDSFPNAEVFVIAPDGRDVLLFDFRTAGGRQSGVARLFGRHRQTELGTFAVP